MDSTTLELPLPRLSEGRFASIVAFTDEDLYQALGIRIAFTERTGGVSTGPYTSLNFGSHVEDDPESVARNRSLLMDAMGVAGDELVVPTQVHGDEIVTIDRSSDVSPKRVSAEAGADAVIVGCEHVAALLCFADCTPVIIVSPTGRFAVVHAGWRGVDNRIAVKAAREIADADVVTTGDSPRACLARLNVYIGPYIHGECFETGADVHARFVEGFGERCAVDATHINLGEALRTSLCEAGISSWRIADIDACTVCENDRFFSFRAQNGVAGRHGAFAVRV